MKNAKKLIALLLAAALCLMLLAACGSSSDSAAADDEDQTSETAAETESEDVEEASEDAEEASEETEEAAEETEDAEEEDMANIMVAMLDINGKVETSDAMIAAINEITESEINVHVDFYMGMGDYATQVSLMLSGGEKLDLVGLTPVPGADFSSMYANGQLMDISELLQSDDAAGMMEIVGGYLDAYTHDGGIYGVPAYRNFATNHYIVMRADVLDELGLTEKAQNMTSWTEYEEILAAVAENSDGTMYAVSKGDTNAVMGLDDMITDMSGEFTDAVYFDKLGDTSNAIAATDDGVGAVVDYEGVEAKYAKLAEWNANGWIYPDSAFDTDNTGKDLMKSGVSFSFAVDSEYGLESQMTAQTGCEVVATMISPKLLCTSTLTSWGLAVPVTSDEPEAAIKFANMCYTDSRIINLLCLGVEGTDYVVTDGVADYVDGNVDNAQWHGSDWLFGNQFLVYPFETESDYREICQEQTEAVSNSSYLGFSLDTSNLSSEIAALTAVSDQYGKSLACGLYDETMYADYVAAIDAAGIDGYIAAINEQLDAWRAA